MHNKTEDCEEVQRDDKAARGWLHDHHAAMNAKWKCLPLQRVGQTWQQLQNEGGHPKEYICPPYYLLIYCRTRFRLFGETEKAVISFSEDDIHSVVFRREAALAFWDACYYLHIGLVHGQIDITYTPPFLGVTPIANARHSEEMRVTFDLHYQPAGKAENQEGQPPVIGTQG